MSGHDPLRDPAERWDPTPTTVHLPTIWTPPVGFGPWQSAGMREFDRANRDGIPTLCLEFRHDDQFLAQYFTAHYLPGGIL